MSANYSAYSRNAVESRYRRVIYGGMDFAQKLKYLIKLRGLTQRKLADLLGTYQSQISRMVDDGAKPPQDTDRLLEIAHILRCSVDYLINDKITDLTGSEFSADERRIIEVVRDSGMTRPEAIRRLTGMAEIRDRDRPPPPPPSGREQRA